MKDYVKEFEILNEKIEKLLEADWFKPSSWFSDKSKESEPNSQYQRSNVVDKHLQSIESGQECAPGISNGRFNSEPGSNSATFYSIKNRKISATGYVTDIKPFLVNAGISKKFLRCYDLKKDKMGIAWLFNGEFNAEVLDWDKKKKKVIFQGIWKNGLFGGLNYPSAEKAAQSPLENRYYILKKGQEIGPFTAGQLLNLVQKGQLTGESIVRPENSTDYQHIKKDKVLSFLLKSTEKQTKPKQKAPSNPAAQL